MVCKRALAHAQAAHHIGFKRKNWSVGLLRPPAYIESSLWPSSAWKARPELLCENWNSSQSMLGDHQQVCALADSWVWAAHPTSCLRYCHCLDHLLVALVGLPVATSQPWLLNSFHLPSFSFPVASPRIEKPYIAHYQPPNIVSRTATHSSPSPSSLRPPSVPGSSRWHYFGSLCLCTLHTIYSTSSL